MSTLQLINPEPKGEGSDDSRKRSGHASGRSPGQRDLLLEVAVGHFRLGRTLDERTFLVPNVGPNVAAFGAIAKSMLAAKLLEVSNTTAARTALDEAFVVLEGLSLARDKESLPLRIAADGNGSVIDIGDRTGSAIIVMPDGWHVVDRSPVTFRRNQTTLPLPTPVQGGSVERLREILNVAPADWQIAMAWLVSTLLPGFSHSILVLRGEQGAAKSTTARFLAGMVDPNSVGLLKPPKDEDRWHSAAASRWVAPIDNVSRIPDWWSDELCRTVTGAGTVKRRLYTDDDVVAVYTKNCVLLNGITIGSALRGDLAERMIPIDLLRPASYMPEAKVQAIFTAIHPEVLGGLLDLAVGVLGQLANVEAPTDLRMADLAHVFAAFDAHLGLHEDEGALAGYRYFLGESMQEAWESDVLAVELVTFMEDKVEWTGTATQLLEALNRQRLDGESSGSEGWWPRNASVLVRALPRSTPQLTWHGIKCETGSRTSKNRSIRLSRITATDADAGVRAPADE